MVDNYFGRELNQSRDGLRRELIDELLPLEQSQEAAIPSPSFKLLMDVIHDSLDGGIPEMLGHVLRDELESSEDDAGESD